LKERTREEMQWRRDVSELEGWLMELKKRWRIGTMISR